MASLPPSTNFTNSSVTQASFKTNFTQLINYLTGLFGTTGTTVDALSILGAAPLDSPILTGVPTAPTAAPSTNNTQIANTAYVSTLFSKSIGDNLVTNGSCKIDQLYKHVSNTSVPDCWTISPSGITFTAAIEGGPEENPSNFSISASANLGSSQHWIASILEGINISRTKWGTTSGIPISLSFKVKASNTGIYNISIQNSATTYSYLAEYTISQANTWTSITIPNIPAPPNGSSFNLTEGTQGIRLKFDLGSVKAGYQGSGGAWLSGNYLCTVDSRILSSGQTLAITNVKVELGSACTPYMVPSFESELVACERYIEKSYFYGTGPTSPNGTGTNLGVATRLRLPSTSAANLYATIPFRVRKAVSPTVYITSPMEAGATGRVYNLSTSTNIAITSTTATQLGFFPNITGVTAPLALEYYAVGTI
jgi:hypothetical protein